MSTIGHLLITIVNLGCTDECDEDERAIRRIFSGASLFVAVAGPIWGSLYMAHGEVGPGLIPFTYGLVTYACFYGLHRTQKWEWFRISQLILIFVLPVALMLSLGGFIPGSAVIVWAVLAPVGALWGGQSRRAVRWIVSFVAVTIVAGLIDPFLRDSNDLPEWLITTFFVMNIGLVNVALCGLIAFYVRQKGELIDVMRRNRELEASYLAQEVSLRQSDKLATLGRLSAGMAHELNNPAAAAQQASNQLGQLLRSQQLQSVERAGLGLHADEQQALDELADKVSGNVRSPVFLDPLDRSDREDAIQDFLAEVGVDDAWELAPSLVSVGMDVSDLATLRSRLRPEKFVDAVNLISLRFTRQSLIEGLNESTDRIINLVGALKTYTYLDQAPQQQINIHEGLDSTLVMLQHQLKSGIEVGRFYGEGIPLIEANGSELNQVWTNIIDNAADAMGGEGTIEIITMSDATTVVIQITDNGPGIPEDIIDNIFDPFVTSKAPGEGTGLGLNIAHNIVTEKHGGTISASSSEAGAKFEIKLPITMAQAGDRNSDDSRQIVDPRTEDAWQSQ